MSSKNIDNRKISQGMRIRAIRNHLKLNQAAFADLLSIKSTSTISEIESGKRTITPSVVELLLVLKPEISRNYIETGEGPMLTDQAEKPGSSSAADLDNDYLTIPLYNVNAAAGHGAIVDREQVVDKLVFRREFIRGELGLNPKDLSLIFVEGDSMMPLLAPGDVILVHHQDAPVIQDGVFVIRVNGGLLVKRLQWLPGGKVVVSSENKAYRDYEMDMTKPVEDFKIIGRVVWAGKRM